jgi:thiamine-phosphate pyrophosphorylase
VSRSRCAPRTLAISQRLTADGADLEPWSRAVAAAGVDAIQIREKDLSARRLLAIAERIVESATRARSAVTILINGRADVAIASGAGGVHLTARGLSLARMRRRFPELVLGVSTHRLDEVSAARDAGADYVVFGPVFAPTSKPEALPPVGLEALAAASTLGVPVLALGGVTLERLAPIASAGAAGVAAIGAFQTEARARSLVAAAHQAFTRATDGCTPRPARAAS